MKHLFLISCVVLAGLTAVSAQRNPTPTSTPIVESSQRQQGLDRQADINRRSTELRMNENFPVKNDAEAKIFRDNVQPIYRAPTKDELKMIAPDAEIERLFSEFLRQKNTGLIKLIPEKNCGETAISSTPRPNARNIRCPAAARRFRFARKATGFGISAI